MLTFIEWGEPVVFGFLILASVLGLAVAIERMFVFRKLKIEKDSIFFHEVGAKFRKHNLESVKNYLTEVPATIYSRFVTFSLEHYIAGHQGLDDLMTKKMLEEKMVLDRRLPILNTLGNNAPFIGLLGTVLGIIKAFYSLGTLGNSGSEVVMRSISSALVATAAGLAVAIPAVIANNYLSRRVKNTMSNLDILSKEILASYSHNQKVRVRSEIQE